MTQYETRFFIQHMQNNQLVTIPQPFFSLWDAVDCINNNKLISARVLRIITTIDRTEEIVWPVGVECEEAKEESKDVHERGTETGDALHS